MDFNELEIHRNTNKDNLNIKFICNIHFIAEENYIDCSICLKFQCNDWIEIA